MDFSSVLKHIAFSNHGWHYNAIQVNQREKTVVEEKLKRMLPTAELLSSGSNNFRHSSTWMRLGGKEGITVE
jgi:hypothetical protein